MASTILVKDAMYRVSVILQDVVPQFAYWPEHELVQWMNDAQAAITKFLPSACSRVDIVKLKAGSRQSIEKILAADCKPGDGSTPTLPIYGKVLLDVVRNMGADGASPGKAIRLIDRDVKDGQSPGWHAVAGDGTVDSFMYDPRTPRYFYVSKPATVSPVTWIEIAYTAQPLQIDNSGTATDTITIDDEFLDDVVNYVVARAHMKGSKYGDPSKAVAYTGMFTSSLNAKVTAATGNSPQLKMLPLAS